ncbi:Ff.00g017950.m01.CDS01 [Fusarium sp. VM40]|nr:Ff.00g017950.m01.CDS01 [Fusarium sp. VM40]
MASAQEAEQIILELNGGYKLGAHVHDNVAKLLFNLLLQADNKSFTKAALNNSAPSISFEIHPKHIIVDCNEDGLTKSDLESMCKTTTDKEETTTAAIFKSIVAAAERVHIQSGNFSLEFRHNLVDSKDAGLKPVWAPAAKEIPSLMTRMTIYLHDHGDKSDVFRMKHFLTGQFMDLRGTCLLFLRKLEQVTVRRYIEHGTSDPYSTDRFYKKAIGPSRVSLEWFSGDKVEKNMECLYFYIERNSDVTLAFPLRQDGTPRDSDGKIFNILPIQASNYNFHIHSRFELDGKQHAIDPESHRNLLHRDEVENTLIQAIQTFCVDPKLRYHWPLFLPTQAGGTTFWKGLDANIHTWIQRNPIMLSRNLKQLRLIHHVMILTGGAADHNHNPLLDDPTTDQFLSGRYSQQAIDRMKCVDTRMRQKTASVEWHKDVASVLSLMPESLPCFHRMKKLPLLPLRDGTWGTIDSGPVFFPCTGHVDIPEIANLRVICSSACRIPERYKLFELLGVTRAAVPEVTKLILERLEASDNLSLSEVKGCLHFLYLTRKTSNRNDKSQTKRIKVLTADMKLRSAHDKVVYLPGTDHAYSPESLLGPRDEGRALSVSFLHPDILADAPGESGKPSLDWKAWLCDFCGVRERITLLSPFEQDLSDHFLYVHNQSLGKFVGLFEHLFTHEAERLERSPDLISKINDLAAGQLCRGGFPLTFRDTWFPNPHSEMYVDQYMEYPESFPFLKFEEHASVFKVYGKYKSLARQFAIGKGLGVDFDLEILRYINKASPGPLSVRQSSKVIDLYLSIFVKYLGFFSNAEVAAKIRQVLMFFEGCGILVPDAVTPTWASLSSCVWNGPPGMIKVHSLKRQYMSRITDTEKRKNIEKFLHVSLGIQNTTVDALMSELIELRRLQYKDPRRILGIYQYWNAELDVNPETRALFEETPLIFAKSQSSMGWYKIRDCVWPSNTSLGGKATLSDLYVDLKEFFVNKLGVEDSEPITPYAELKHPSRRSVKDIKATIMQLSSLLRTTTVFLNPEPIRKSKIFPVKGLNGAVSLYSVDANFFIKDTLLYEDWLCHLSVLDFDIQEFQRLKPFFSWLGTEDRYLSRCVEEQTSLPNHVGSPILSGPRYFGRKSYHILRIGAAFGSPRFLKDKPGFCKQLSNLQIIEIEGITSVERITQNGQELQTPTREAYCHFVESPQRLVIYVPKETKAREICFRTFLPRKLAGWLMHPDGQRKGDVDFEMVNALTSILAGDGTLIDDILSSLSIPKVTHSLPGWALDEEETYGDEEEEEEEEEEYDSEYEDYKREGESDEGVEMCDDVSEEVAIPQSSPKTHETSPEVIPSTPQAPAETGPSQPEVELVLRQAILPKQAHTGDGDISDPSQIIHLSEPDSAPTPQVTAS